MLWDFLAFFGVERAQRAVTLNKQARLAKILSFLEGADSELDPAEYDFVQRFFPAGLMSEYKMALRQVHRKYTIIGCRAGHVECSQRLKIPLTSEQLGWMEEERQRTSKRKKRRPTTDAAPGESIELLNTPSLEAK